MNKNNVIDFTKLRAFKTPDKKNKAAAKNQEKASLLDMTERRQEIINQERREVRRTILTGFIGAFVVVPKRGLLKADIYDISADGISFDLEAEAGYFKKSEEVAMRIYMNHNTYFTFSVQIQNARAIIDEGANRHGGKFLKGSVNDEALSHFVKFIETVSLSLERDSGDVMVSNLKK
jgi:hypothetical protein